MTSEITLTRPIDLPTTLLFGCVPEPVVRIDVTLLGEGELARWASVAVDRGWEARERDEGAGGGAYVGTALDPRLGKEPGGFHRSAKCALCNFPWRRCTGHFGVRRDAFLFNPAMAAQLARALGAISPVATALCGEDESGLLLAFSLSRAARDAALASVRALPAPRRLAALRKHALTQKRGKGAAKRDSGVRWALNFRQGVAAVSVDAGPEQTLSAQEVHALLARLTPFDLETMGVGGALTGLVFRDLPVLPTPARPTALRGGLSVPHPYTHSYNRVVGFLRRADEARAAAAAPQQQPAAAPPRATLRRIRVPRGAALGDTDRALANRVLAELLWPKALGRRRKARPSAPSHDVVPRPIGEALSGKDGELRGTVLGKRAFDTLRSNIVPDCSLRHGQVGVPACLARLVTVQEPCNAWSRAVTLVGHRGVRYLTDMHVVKVHQRPGEQNEDGDIVLRPLRDGDVVALNRQPTLSNASMFGMEVVLVPGRAIRMHCDVCPTFHADFDGDEMNNFVPGGVEAAAEMRELMGLAPGLLSDATSRPNVGLHQDAVLGMYLLTLPETRLSRAEVLRLTAAAGAAGIFPSSLAGEWAGADVVAVALRGLPADFLYAQGSARVANRRLVLGPLRKAHVGTGAGGLVHCVARTVSPEAALKMLDGLSALANEFLMMRPPLMTGADILLRGGSPVEEVDEATGALFAQARTPQDACELSERVALRAHARRVNDRIAAGARNAFTLLVEEAKCKGSNANLCQHYGAVGQQTVGGRPPARAAGGRALPLFPTGQPASPREAGFVAQALADGLRVAENYFHTWASRSGLVEGRLNTPAAGYQQRELVQPLKPCVAAHDGTVSCEGTIVQFCYGGDGAAPSRAVTLELTRQELAAAEDEAGGAGPLALAVAALRAAGEPNALPGQPLRLSLPVPLLWLRERAAGSGGPPADPRTIAADVAAVHRAALGLRPWAPSRLTRAALIFLARPSELSRLNLRGAALAAFLEAVRLDWNTSRVPAGMPVGVFVGTSIGPPATQNSLDAFHVAGMHRSGAGAQASAQDFEALLSASRGAAGMVLYVSGGEAEARALAARLPQRTLQSYMPRGAAVRVVARTGSPEAAALLSAVAAVGDPPVDPERALLVPLRAGNDVSPREVGEALARAIGGLRVIDWPLHRGELQFLVAVTKTPANAQFLAKHVASRIIGGVPGVLEAYPARALDGRWTVETKGSNLARALAERCVNASSSFSRCVRDTADVLGIEAARATAYREIRRVVGSNGVDRRHMALFADFMTHGVEPVAFSRHGMKSAGIGPVARALYETPLAVFTEAALAGATDSLGSLTTQIFVGRLTTVGTGFSKVLADPNAESRGRQRV